MYTLSEVTAFLKQTQQLSTRLLVNQFGSLDFNCSSASTGLKHTKPTAVTAIALAICLCAMDRNRNNSCFDTTKNFANNLGVGWGVPL